MRIDIFLSLLFLLILVGCFPDKDSGFFRVEIAERVFKVPKGYLDGAPAYGRDTESVLLKYSLPGFEILPPYSNKAARQKLVNEGRFRNMLLERASKRPSLETMTSNLIMRRGYKKENNNIHGLEKYSAFNPSHIDAQKPDDIFIERDANGGVASFLICSPLDKDKIPACNQTFINKGILYSLSWRIQEFPKWKEQQADAIFFIDSMEHNSSIRRE